MRSIILLFSLTLLSQVNAQTGFQAGDIYEAHYNQGRLHLTCSHGPQYRTVTWNCYENYLSPRMVSKFVTDSAIEADRVLIETHNHKGIVQTRTSRFDSEKGSSKRRFNLWINSVFQSPLLDYGINKVSYKLTHEKKEVEAGEFEVEVKRMPRSFCLDDWGTSYNMNDCFNPQLVCSQYFIRNRRTCR